MAAKTKTKKKKGTGVDQRLVKALAHPLRVEILTILNERMASPNELSKELEEGLSQVSYHVKVLKDFECIEMVKTEPRRGAVEHYYRATSRAFLTDSDWQSLPESVKPGVSASSIQMIIDDVVGALTGGTFDARDDRHHDGPSVEGAIPAGWLISRDGKRLSISPMRRLTASSRFTPVASSGSQSLARKVFPRPWSL